MTQFIEIQNFTPPPGREYDVTAWPGPGMYKTNLGSWFMVYPVGTSHCVIGLGVASLCPIPSKHRDELVPPVKPEPPTGVTAQDLLKAIAISQNPLLAKELLR